MYIKVYWKQLYSLALHLFDMDLDPDPSSSPDPGSAGPGCGCGSRSGKKTLIRPDLETDPQHGFIYDTSYQRTI
jgi:hypothetical protein